MTHAPRLLAIMGSGETAPTMATVHRLLLERFGPPPAEGVLLDTPYGFQENADEISRRALAYFGRHVSNPFQVATWRSATEDALRRDQALAKVRRAAYVFAGPGSPSYALQVWRDSPLRDALAEKLASGGCVTFASAAALTLGLAAVPVYEIYKVGAPPHWLDGMDLLAEVGLRAAVIPHYDNAEGDTYDTRFCYLGERRLALLEAALPPDAFVLGVDEHTACVLDLAAGTATVLGRGAVTIRRRGCSTTLPAGSTVPIDDLPRAAPGRGWAAKSALKPPANQSPPSLLTETDLLERRFDTGVADRDLKAAITALLDLEQVLFEWSADLGEEGQLDQARTVLHRMITRVGELAVDGARDPSAVIAPFVDALVDVRDRARADRSWELADALRNQLAAAGITVRDTPEGTAWILDDPPAQLAG